MLRRSPFIAFTLVACFVVPAGAHPARAQAGAGNHARLSLIADQSAFAPGRPLWVGVLFHLDPGWHIYWQNPGDSGTPPRIQWTLPQGFSAGALKWPVPRRLGGGSVIDYGYQNDVLLMAPVTPASGSSGDLAVAADVRYVVCRELCVPGKAHLTLSIPASTDHAEHFPASHGLFEATRGEFPKPAPVAWKISARSEKGNFMLVVRGLGPQQGISFFPDDASVVDNPAPQNLAAVPGGFSLALKKSDLLTGSVKALKGLLNVPGQGSFEITAPVVQK